MPEPASPLDTYQRHVSIVETVERRNMEAARVAMKRHYTGIQERLAQMEAIKKIL